MRLGLALALTIMRRFIAAVEGAFTITSVGPAARFDSNGADRMRVGIAVPNAPAIAHLSDATVSEQLSVGIAVIA